MLAVSSPPGSCGDIRPVIATHPDGNVQARAWVRWLEIQESVSLIRRLLDSVSAKSALRPVFGCPTFNQTPVS